MEKEDTVAKTSTEVEIPELYSNSVEFGVSAYEFTFMFGLKGIKKGEPKPLVNVRMSPQHAKVMSLLLAKNVRNYEKEIGEISLPSKLINELKLNGGESWC